MFRIVVAVGVVLFALGMMQLAFGPVVEDVGDTVGDRDAVQELGLDDTIDDTRKILLVWLPLLAGGGIVFWGVVRAARKGRFAGQGGVR